MTSAWDRQAIEALGPTTDAPTTASIMSLNKDTVYGAIRRGEWTATRVLRFGRKIRIPTRDLIALLYESPTDASTARPAVPSQCQHHAYPQVDATQSQSQCGCRGGEFGATLVEGAPWGTTR